MRLDRPRHIGGGGPTSQKENRMSVDTVNVRLVARQLAGIPADQVVFSASMGGAGTPIVLTLAEVRAWGREACGAGLRRFIRQGGALRRIR
jgi:hypothetical protein